MVHGRCGTDTQLGTGGGGGGLGSNLSSTTDDFLSDNGTILLGGTGGTNNETIDFDFETTANTVGLTSATGVTMMDVGFDMTLNSSDTTVGGYLRLENSDTSIALNQSLGRLGFYSNDSSSNSSGEVAYIEARADIAFAGTPRTGLGFFINSAAPPVPSEAMRITWQGQVHINNASSSSIGSGQLLNVVDTTGRQICLAYDTSTYGTLGVDVSGDLDYNYQTTTLWTVRSNGIVDYTCDDNITASTTQTQGQQPLTAPINEVGTVANTDDVVTLPSAVSGRRCVIMNNGANQLQIFPATGDNAGAGINASVTLASGSNVEYIAYDATNWEAL